MGYGWNALLLGIFVPPEARSGLLNTHDSGIWASMDSITFNTGHSRLVGIRHWLWVLVVIALLVAVCVRYLTTPHK